MTGKWSTRMTAIATLTAALLAGSAFAADAPAPAATKDPALKDRTIGYALTDFFWAIYQSPDGKAECPQGYNDGPREQFKQLFPEDGTKRSYQDTALAREAQVWFPTIAPEQFVFHEAEGKTSYGLNLDGKVGPNDFTSPEGEKGIDNNLYRALGCISNYRGPDGTLYHFTDKYLQQHNYNRIVIELTNVDSLQNDDSVDVAIYRAKDKLFTDATGNDFVPGGTQRVDMRWGKQFIRHTHGKITNGVLLTDPVDVVLPATAAFEDTTVQKIKGARLRLNLTPDHAEGLLAGYTDVEAFYRQLNESWSTHHQSYGQESSPSLYRALKRLADGYPDPKTGENTAISSAAQVKFVQVFVQHPPKVTASKDGRPDAAGQ